MRITMLGGSSSGKTTYMAALHHVMGKRKSEDFHIRPPIGAVESLHKIGDWRALDFVERKYQFPFATSDTTEWLFDMYYADDQNEQLNESDVVTQFEWIDYRGADVTDYFDRSTREQLSAAEQEYEQRKLLDYLRESDGIIIFLDSILLSYYKDLDRRITYTNADCINTILRLLVNYHTEGDAKPVDILVLLSKADSDAIGDKYREDGFSLLKKLAREVLWEAVDICKKNERWTGGIIPVGAVGKSSTFTEISVEDTKDVYSIKTEIRPPIEPFNCECPLFYCVGQYLKRHRKQIKEAQLALRQKEEEIKQRQRRSNLLYWFLRLVFGERGLPKQLDRIEKGILDNYFALTEYGRYLDPMIKLAREAVDEL